MGQESAPASQAVTSSAAGPSKEAPPSPTAPTSGSIPVHFERLAFDVPAPWSVRVVNLNEHYVTILGFVGTAPSSAGCEPASSLPSGAISGTECSTDLALGPGQVAIEILRLDSPGQVDPLDFSANLTGEARMTQVAGAPAVLNPNDTIVGGQAPPDGHAASLLLPVPGTVASRYELVGFVRGPGIDALMAQVLGVFDSVRYDPPIAPLPTDPATEATITRQAVVHEADGCFPAESGATATARITELPGSGTATHPVEAICRTDLAPTPIELWRLSLTASWTGSGGAAKSSVTTVWLAADGSQIETTGRGDPFP